MSMSDAELLQRYVQAESAADFREIVRRHLDLVYSVARRQTGSPSLAEDIAQNVFIELARHARAIKPGTPLVAWLHIVSRRTALNAVRAATRRQSRELAAAEFARSELAESAAIETMNSSSDSWHAVEPLLDEAVETLSEPDRTAILLRFFENKSLRDIGAALGTSDDAAQKRVTRALDRLRAFFLRRGIAVTTAGLTTDLCAHALHVAPAGLGATISGAVVFSTAAVANVGTSHIIAMTTLQKSAAVAVFAVLGGTGIYQAQLVARQSDEINALQQQSDRASAEVNDLRRARTVAATKFRDVEQRIDTRLAAAHPVAIADAALELQMHQWLAQIDRMKDFLAQRPDWNIPELKLLAERDWFNAAVVGRVESDEQFRRTTAQLRDLAVSRAAQKISRALNAYVLAHDGLLPNSPLELLPYADPPIDPAMLGRYEMLHTGKTSGVPLNETNRILAPRPADVEYDAYHYIGTSGYGNNGVAMGENVRGAQRRFADANNGARVTTAEQLLPYLRWPVSAAALQKYLTLSSSSGTP